MEAVLCGNGMGRDVCATRPNRGTRDRQALMAEPAPTLSFNVGAGSAIWRVTAS
ncbi:hypothetical protein SAMN05444165_3350 [Paraburkholderia phenazinium]|uniref:Uncharacterized protein n=1 Tax=Paraburkholderia phenazinium TaxID=60549 RepID=A0A1N6JMM4_9BURK|nr:hypothetical protein SAMN05444165_3350 [Paraburkholderia phenazinium]